MGVAGDIVRAAYREDNLKAIGTALTDNEMSEGLLVLNNFLTSLYGFELGDYYSDWPVPPSTTSPVPAQYPLYPANTNLPQNVWPYPPQNVRILARIETGTTIYLPSTPNDGARISIADIGSTADIVLTIDANGRLIDGQRTLVDTPANITGYEFFYRADLGNWIRLITLTELDISPLPNIFDDLLITGVAIRLASRFGVQINASTAERFTNLMRRLKTQYRQVSQQPNQSPQAFIVPSTSREDGYLATGSLFI